MNERQKRMLAAGAFHFYSHADQADVHADAAELEEQGLIHIDATDLGQETVYNCTKLPREESDCVLESYDNAQRRKAKRRRVK